MQGKEFYTVEEVARILRLSRDRVYEYLRTGRLRGSRLTEHSAWRIPASELERLKGIDSPTAGSHVETKPGTWTGTLDVAAQLQSNLSRLDAKDWAIWGLPDSGQSPLTSEAGLRIWMDRGKLAVKLAVEGDDRFPLLLTEMKTSFPQFDAYDRWRESLNNFVRLCSAVAREICSQAESKTGLVLSSVPVMGKGHLLNVPKFVYEFALDNYASTKQPILEILPDEPDRYRLVPGDLPYYILAIGSKNEMQTCHTVTLSLINQYTQDERVGQINTAATRLQQQTAPLQEALSILIAQATAQR